MSLELLFRALPQRIVPTVAVVLCIFGLGWLSHNVYTFNSSLPDSVAAQSLRIDTVGIKLEAIYDIDRRQDLELDVLRAEQGSIYDYLEKILCRQEAAEGLVPVSKCNRIEVRRPGMR